MIDLAIVVSNHNKNNNIYESIDAIKKSGFKNVFIQLYHRNYEVDYQKQIDYVKESGLNIIFAHLDYININDIWNSIDNNIVDAYKKDLDICKLNDIDLVIMHVTRKTDGPMYNENGIKKLQEIVDYAEKLNIKIAFENTLKEEYLEYVINNINNKNVGVCFDTGHYHCHSKDKFNIDKYKNKILAVHLHDNYGENDEHLIPYDGNLNWNKVLMDLKLSNYNSFLTLESVYQKDYLNESIDSFYKKCFESANKIKKEFESK